MSKRYKDNSALQQIINEQQKDIDQLENKVINSEFVIDSIQKESDKYVLTCKFLTDILILTSQLEKILGKDYTIFSQSLQTAIASFKVELSKAMQTVQYDGGDSYTFAPYFNDNNDIDTNDYE
jgi:hypothetical protein